MGEGEAGTQVPKRLRGHAQAQGWGLSVHRRGGPGHRSGPSIQGWGLSGLTLPASSRDQF